MLKHNLPIQRPIRLAIGLAISLVTIANSGACSNKNLSRSRALGLLEIHNSAGEELTHTIMIEDYVFEEGGLEKHKARLLEDNTCFVKLLELGLATDLRTFTRANPHNKYTSDWRVDLTDEALLLVRRKTISRHFNEVREGVEVLAGKRRIRRIASISEPTPALGLTVSHVNFVWGYEDFTLLANVCSKRLVDDRDNSGIATFALYDDGWKLDSVSW